MTFGTYFFILLGVLSLTYQFFRLIEFLEHPAPRPTCRRVCSNQRSTPCREVTSTHPTSSIPPHHCRRAA